MPHLTEEKNQNQQDFTGFVESHISQLQGSNIPQAYWPTLHEKLSEEIFDAGSHFKILCYEDEDSNNDSNETAKRWKVVTETEIMANDPQHIYLIDHAWTYRISDARTQLQTIPGLLDRMTALMDIDAENKEQDDAIDSVLTKMWRYNQTYSFGHFEWGSDESVPFWYIMDEFGSRIQHSDTPTFRTVPFFHIPSKFTFTLLWPLNNVEEGDEVTRNFVENTISGDVRQARLLPWQPCDLKHISFKQKEPETSYFLNFKMNETYPDPSAPFPELPKDRNIRVYLKYRMFPEYLTDSRFELVDTIEEADIIWIQSHWKDHRKFSVEMPNKFINQFPNETVVTVKDLLAIVSRRAGGAYDDVTMEEGPKWLPVTYNLQTELPQFVSYFQHRQEKGLDNHWICKPWNLARGLDMHITDNIEHIVRLPDTGPKVACKYVEDPVLFYREEIGNVKFDIRYIVMLASVKPLKLYAYKVFWLRFANKPFSLDHFDEYEKHFTVMNYAEGVQLKQVHYDEFIPMFESQYPAYSWKDVEEDIFQMFRELFTAATSMPSPHGIAHSPHSRAIYALDFLLKWSTNDKGEKTMQPVLCEANFCPDCDRACKYHPFFVNDVFSTLFLDDIEGRLVTLL